MAFKFRFDSLLTLRRQERDEAGVEVGKAHEAIRRVDEQIEDVQKQRDELRVLSAGMFRGPEEKNGSRPGHQAGNRPVPNQPHSDISVDRVLQQGRYDLQLQADQVNLRQTKDTLLQELERRRGRLVEAEAEVKRLERLRETRQNEHYQSELQREQAESDDLTTARMIIAKRNRSRT